MAEKILITAALPYANGPLHFGHIAGAYLPSDCYARFERLWGNDVLFICGSDEYGVAITMSAQLANRSFQEHVDIFHEMNKNFFSQLEFSFDHYSRTTWPGHKEVVQQFFSDLCDNGYVEEKVEDHLYSEDEKQFLADRYVEGICPKCGYEKARGDECPKCGASFEAIDLINPKSKISQKLLIKKPSKQWYLRFDKFQDSLTKWLAEKKWKPNVVAFTKNYIKELKPRSITRDATWGIKVPLSSAEGKVFYVWFDAPIGYISASKEWAEKINQKDRWKDYWMDKETKLVHFIGKDNIPFHTIFFPAMIMGQNYFYVLPSEVPANEFLLFEGKQFSKSEGWTIDLEDFFKRYTPDQIRYYLAANAPETSDSEFIWKDFQQKCNSDLLNKFGNFIHRSLTFIKNNRASAVPPIGKLQKIDEIFLEDIDKKVNEIAKNYQHFHLRKASQLIMELAHLGNVYFDEKKPWKQINDIKLMNTTMACCIECIKALALVSSPIIPKTAQEIWKMLGNNTSLEKGNWKEIKDTSISTGQTLPTPKVLFRKIEDEEIEKEEKKLHKTKKVQEKKTISFSDFSKVEMKVGEIIKAKKVEKSKKLLKLTVDIGDEVIRIVSGIAMNYSPEDIIGKNVIVVVNLKPAKIMGIDSHGMILAAGDKDQIELPLVQNQKPGSIVS